VAAAAAASAKTKAPKLRKTQLRADLKQYRIQQSEPLNKPPYTIFTNAAIDGIYALLPTTKEELLKVKGIGPMKLEMFGDDILEIVSKYTTNGGADSSDDESSTRSSSSSSSLPQQPTRMDPAMLTPEQRRAVELALSSTTAVTATSTDQLQRRRNLFITGSAGTGKSHVLQFLVQECRQASRHQKLGVCAPTGVAAINVGGSTLHSYFGIGLGTGSLAKLVQKVQDNAEAKKRINETAILIVDECSMLSSQLLEVLDGVAREVRRNGRYREEPFGGMQVIFFGDFFQLPPIVKGNGGDPWRPFCFDSPVWSELGLTEHTTVELKEVQRQKNNEFVDLLNKVRIGQIDEGDIRNLNARCLISENHPLPTDGIVPTRLYVLNRDVDSVNESRLAELEGEEVVCKARDIWRTKMPTGTLASVKKKMAESLRMELPDEVKLKVGAQVMLIRNKDLENNLVNGSRGVVVGFEQGRGRETFIPIVRFDTGLVTRIPPVESVRYNPDGGEGCLVRLQTPLKLAWAMTVHKSQGTTLTRALLDISSAFEYGQCYVALSRVRSLEGLWLERPARLRDIKVSPQVLDFHRRMKLQ